MSLSQYHKKRNFSDTPEPEGKEKHSKSALRFVVQKHDASQLHYDFRLEMEGVLKSWAVPKGPSLNPADKRLAMAVEDHPYDYRNFEGIIPEGNYGAGTVIVWDEGNYEPEGATALSRKEQEKLLLQQLASGSIKFVLHGKKLKGLYTLFRLKKGDEKAWLLIKKSDDFAQQADITAQDTSVKSGKTIAQVANDNGVAAHHPEERKKTAAKKAATKKAAPKKVTTAAAQTKSSKKKAPDALKLFGKFAPLAKASAMPQQIKPMLATLVDEPFNNEDWLFEIKWDGYRALAYKEDAYCEILSRNNRSFTQKYYPVTEALQGLEVNAVLDGEIVAINEEGLAEFQLLQSWQTSGIGTLRYYVFDVLWLNGYDLTALHLIERKKILQKILPPHHPVLSYSDHVEGAGKSFFKVALKQGLEGIIAKKKSSTYERGNRSSTWLKIKVSKRQEVIIAGFTQPRNTRKFFGALLLGVYQGKELRYIGHTGSGFNRKLLEDIWHKLQPLIFDKSPFAHAPKTNMPATWVKPELVCEIKFTEWTNELQARHPIFMGLREDKNAKEVTIENSAVMRSIVKGSKSKTKKEAAPNPSKRVATKAAAPATAARKNKKISLDKTVKEQTTIVNGHELKFTNADKMYWKKEGVTKGDVLEYYANMAPYIMPYMIDRPQSLHRHPNGISGAHFFQKDVRGKVPEWMQSHEDFSESTDETVQYLVCSNEATLLYMANLGCIEMHPWHSRIQQADKPDYCLIDLDPDKNNSFNEVMQTAQVVKQVLDAVKAPCYCKTSGSTGIHIYIPLGAKYSYDQSKQLAELVVNLVQRELPDSTSVERSPAKRKGKIYLDFLQNKQTQTVAAPYSLRPKPGAPVSTPLDWSELKKGLTPTTYNLHNIFDRLKCEGDLFQPVLGKGINLEKVLEKIESIT